MHKTVYREDYSLYVNNMGSLIDLVHSFFIVAEVDMNLRFKYMDSQKSELLYNA